jgi:hypothetical protein
VSADALSMEIDTHLNTVGNSNEWGAVEYFTGISIAVFL